VWCWEGPIQYNDMQSTNHWLVLTSSWPFVLVVLRYACNVTTAEDLRLLQEGYWSLGTDRVTDSGGELVRLMFKIMPSLWPHTDICARRFSPSTTVMSLVTPYQRKILTLNITLERRSRRKFL
jgi:hypothetical protein